MMIFLWLLIGVGIYYLFAKDGIGNSKLTGNKNSTEILKERYVNGEINEETFKKMLDTINR